MLSKKKIQNLQFEEKRSARQCNGVRSLHHRGIKFKENPDAKQNKDSHLRARFHPVKFPTCEKELKDSLAGYGDTHV